MFAITVFLLCLTNPISGVFDSWVDPTFEGAVKSAALIALGSPTEVGEDALEVRCDDVLAGKEENGAIVSVRRFHGRNHPMPVPGKGLKIVMLVQKDKQGYMPFSRTYFAWPRTGDVVDMPIRDPFDTISLKVSDLKALVMFLRAPKPDPKELKKFLDNLLARLAKTVVKADKLPQVETQVLALETLYFFGTKEHVKIVTPYLGSPWYHVRRSVVRALQRCGGPAADAALLAHLPKEDVPPVLSSLGEALFGRVAKESRKVILEAAKKASDESILLSGRLMNPIMNSLPAPRYSLAAVVLRIDGEKADYYDCCQKAKDSWERLLKTK